MITNVNRPNQPARLPEHQAGKPQQRRRLLAIIGHKLQFADQHQPASGSWSNVTSGITTVSTNDVFTNNVNGKASFFRLQSP